MRVCHDVTAVFDDPNLLEVVDENTPDDTIERIESYWKNKLLSRQFGLNRN